MRKIQLILAGAIVAIFCVALWALSWVQLPRDFWEMRGENLAVRVDQGAVLDERVRGDKVARPMGDSTGDETIDSLVDDLQAEDKDWLSAILQPGEPREAVMEPAEVTLVAVGDIMLSRFVATKMERYGDYTYPFLETADFLREADLTFGNLECPIADGRQIGSTEMVFRADREVREGLVYAGFDVLSVANNHTMNFGEEAMKDTLHYLKVKKIKPVGGGRSYEEAHQSVIKEVKGLKLAFLAYTDTDVVPDSYGATGVPASVGMTGEAGQIVAEGKPGVAFMEVAAMEADVAAALNEADLVIVSMHSGTEYVSWANQRQIEFAHKAIEAGASLVLGHHPHVIQPVEKYLDGYILYSLGNFVFDQMWSQPTREGLVAEIVLSAEGVQEMDFRAIVIEDWVQPRWASPEESERILETLGAEWQNGF